MELDFKNIWKYLEEIIGPSLNLVTSALVILPPYMEHKWEGRTIRAGGAEEIDFDFGWPRKGWATTSTTLPSLHAGSLIHRLPPRPAKYAHDGLACLFVLTYMQMNAYSPRLLFRRVARRPPRTPARSLMPEFFLPSSPFF